MSSAADILPLRPGYLLDYYPERIESKPSFWQQRLKRMQCTRRTRRVRRRAMKTGQQVAAKVKPTEHALTYAEVAELRQLLGEHGWQESTLIDVLAIVGEQVEVCFGFRPHPSQFAGAWSMLQGVVVEMATGEGKTITAALAAIVAGLSGAKVHVVTTNDYLVERDAQAMRQLYESFGLDSGYAVQRMDDNERRAAYSGDVCYVSNKILVFDYLRDRQIFGREPVALSARLRGLCRPAPATPLLQGLCFAIVDEVDSALIDDAVTPLILSYEGDSRDELVISFTALSLAQRLSQGSDFSVDHNHRRVRLTAQGETCIEGLAQGLEGVWQSRRYCVERVSQALACLHVYIRDVDYLVKNEQVILIDQSTGRVMPDRKLQNGLHQMLEAKEKCEVSGRSHTLASLSFQKFFPRYTLLAGMSGTVVEAASELCATYGLGVVPIPTHESVNRNYSGARFASTEEEYLQWMGDAIEQRITKGQPVLVGTRSLAHSEKLSACLSARGLTHSVLNARQDEEEATLIAQAGQASRVTIATNMAGRGTDIKITEGVRAAGGLHVIVSQLNDSARVDRQLIGRCSRQGDPGSYEYLIAPDDQVWGRRDRKPQRLRGTTRLLSRTGMGSRRLLSRARRLQHRIEEDQRALRRQVARADNQMQENLAFTGYKE